MIKKFKTRWGKALSRQDWRCTMFPNIAKNCCVKHDYDCAYAWYYMDAKLRKKADLDLRNCANLVFPVVGEIMYIGVRLFNFWKKITKKPEY